MDIKQWIKAEAKRLGFPFAGITSLDPPPHLETFEAWIASGMHAGMGYLAAPLSQQKRADPRSIFPAAKSVLSLAMPYAASGRVALDPTAGRVASYAWGTDYHDVIPARLALLADRIEVRLGCQVTRRAYTDTGPILERDLAQRAGLGWQGKNTCLITPQSGSYFFLAELFLDLNLEPDVSFRADHCGTCRRCIEACPTGCIREDRTLDSSRCISYQTIENKGPIPHFLRPQLGNWIFGCDICQQVCPWNRFALTNPIEDAFQARPDVAAPVLLDELRLDARGFNLKFHLSPVRRTKRRGYLRNVCIALGNAGDAAAAPALLDLLKTEPEGLIRGAAAWAANRLDPQTAIPILEQAAGSDSDALVREDIRITLGG